ncbi:unnamed protein product [Tilletia controversa]|nr:unnamed protein product [Tilletia controversa]CAD6927040.1 unnamed protein product [Tilletia controversa]
MPNSWPSRLRRALRTTGLVAMPDGAMISFTQGGNLYYDSADGAPTLVTRQDGTTALEETSDAEDEEPLQHAGTAGTAGYTVPTSNAEDEVQDVGGSAPLQHAGTDGYTVSTRRHRRHRGLHCGSAPLQLSGTPGYTVPTSDAEDEDQDVDGSAPLQHAGTETALPSSPATVFSPATTRDDTPEPFITSSTPALFSVPAASSASDLGPVSSGTRSSTSAPVSSGSSSSTSAPVSSGSSSSTSAPASRQQDEGNRTHRGAAAHLTLRLAHSTAARNAILGNAVSAGMSLWLLEDVLVFHPRSPPSCLRKTPGSKKAFFLSKTEQVKERWRCQAEGCDAVRTVDPNVTNVLHRHYKMAHQQHPSPKTLAS